MWIIWYCATIEWSHTLSQWPLKAWLSV